MSLPTNNPFLMKNYFIYETNTPWATCSGPQQDNTRIFPVGDPAATSVSTSGYNKIGPFTYGELDDYLGDLYKKMAATIGLAHRCDAYGLAMNNNTKLQFPSECNATFANFSNQKIETLRSNLINNKTPYVSQFGQGKNMYDTFSYTPDYLYQQQNDNNTKKPLCQQMADIIQILGDMNVITQKLNTEENKSNYREQYDSIIGQHKKNTKLREELDRKLREVYSSNKSIYGNSKLYLDATVYTTVLWTIVATTLLYYVFVKL